MFCQLDGLSVRADHKRRAFASRRAILASVLVFMVFRVSGLALGAGNGLAHDFKRLGIGMAFPRAAL